jgi:lysophospholipase L1-like esterase
VTIASTFLGGTMTDHSSKSGRGISRRGLLQGAAVTLGGAALTGAASSPASAAVTKPFIPSGLTYAANDPLAGFFRKVAAGTATIVTAGDSITEAFGAANPQKGYPARVRARLRNGAGQAPGGLDYIPARSQYTTVRTPPATATYVTYAGLNGAAIDLRSATYAGDRSTRSGLGRRAVALTSSRVRSLSFTQRFTSLVLAWRATSGTRDAVSITIDGTTVPLPAVSSGEQTWTSPRRASATHTVTVTWESGEPFVEGWQLFDGDEGGGFHVLEASQSESRTEGFALASSAANGNDSWADALRRFSPDLITSMWGTNDYGKVTPAVLTQQTRNYLDLVHDRSPASALLVVMPYQLGAASATEWAKYRAAQQQAVSTFRSANPGVAIGFFDLGAYVPPYFGQTGAKDNPYMSDGIHPSDTGYDVIAAILYAYFTSTPA